MFMIITIMVMINTTVTPRDREGRVTTYPRD